MVDVRVSWLQTFVAVAEERHFGRAAVRVRHSPSAVSRHVRQLEDVLGWPLLERTTRTVAMTPAGRRLYAEIASPLDALSRALTGSDTTPATVALGYTAAAADHLVPEVAWRWSRGSDVQLQLVPSSSGAQLQAIRDGGMDVGVHWAGSTTSGDLSTTRLLTEPMRVALPVAHPRAGIPAIGAAELARSTWLMAADRTDRAVRDHLTSVCARHGFTPRIKDAATGHSAQLLLVAAGHGICLVPPTALPGCRLPVSFTRIVGEHIDLVAVTRPNPRATVSDLVELLARAPTLVRPDE